MSQLRSWARLLGGEVRGGQVLCPGPGHSAADRSLSVKVGKDGEPIIFSHAGDDWQACRDYVRARLGMEPFKPNGSLPRATYEFRDPTTGAVRYRKERVEAPDGTKSFFFKPSGRNGSDPLLYGGERLADIAGDQPVFVVEGEKKVDRLRELGAVAVSGDSGASSKWTQAHADLLRGLHVILWPDSDVAGEKYAVNAAECLNGTAASLCVVRPFGAPNGAKGRDVCDWTGNAGALGALVAGAEGYGAVPPNGPDAAGAQALGKRGGDFLKEYEPLSYTHDGILPSASIYGITARQGTGKTVWMIAATLAGIKGNDLESGVSKILGCKVEQGRVAYVIKENPGDYRMKLAVACHVHGIDHALLNKWLFVFDGRSETPEAICEALQKDAETNGLFQAVYYDTFQAGYADEPSSTEFNDNLSVVRFVQRLRKITTIIGRPSALVAFHPTKYATEQDLMPYGGGGIMNEIDGNLTLWGEAARLKLGWNRVRGPQFEPRYFLIEQLSCPDIVDKGGRQILLPVLRPTAEADAEEMKANNSNTDLALLRAMVANPDGSQTEWAFAVGIRAKSSINEKLQKLKRLKLVEERITGKWRITPKGEKELR